MGRLSKEEFFRFADIFESAAQVLFAGLVIQPLLSAEVDNSQGYILVLGTFSTLVCWFASWLLTRKGRKKK